MGADLAHSITINDAYPWGRSFEEYVCMFALTDGDLHGQILACADGPASFNARMHARGCRVISCDPLYRFSADEIRRRIDSTCDVLVDAARQNADRFVWDQIRSPEELKQTRLAAMSEFLADYEQGRRQGRYVAQSLPQLDWPDRFFDLAICSHFLFLYSEQFSQEFHLDSIRQLCRVATEARVFPLLDMQGKMSIHLQPVIERLGAEGYRVAVEAVPYEFQRAGNQMLRIKRENNGR